MSFSKSLGFLIFVVTPSFVMGGTQSSNADEDISWPALDEEGYVQAVRESGTWRNYWSRNKPGLFGVLKFSIESDHSGIKPTELDKTIPIHRPYWLRANNDSNPENKESIRLTWLGHATVLAEIDNDVTILTDPIFSERASLFQWIGPKRYRPVPCSVEELPSNLDAVVISHTHFDHLDLHSVRKLGIKYGSGLRWFVPSGLKSWMIANVDSASEDNVYEMVWWNEIPLKRSKIVFTPSNHWSRRSLFDNDKVLWGSWTVIGPKHKFFFGGDTAYQKDVFKQIRRKYGDIDVCAIPIGAYNPRWFMKFVHVNPEEAVAIHQDLGSKLSLGIHWGTFKLTYEPYLEPKQKILELAREKSITFVSIDPGNFVTYP